MITHKEIEGKKRRLIDKIVKGSIQDLIGFVSEYDEYSSTDLVRPDMYAPDDMDEYSYKIDNYFSLLLNGKMKGIEKNLTSIYQLYEKLNRANRDLAYSWKDLVEIYSITCKRPSISFIKDFNDTKGQPDCIIITICFEYLQQEIDLLKKCNMLRLLDNQKSHFYIRSLEDGKLLAKDTIITSIPIPGDDGSIPVSITRKISMTGTGKESRICIEVYNNTGKIHQKIL